jgi:methionyl-tRNA synthetase
LSYPRVSELNYKFRLSAFKEPLLALYASKPDFVIPQERLPDVIHQVTHHLHDLSVSRLASRTGWGLPVPNDPTHTIYVWIDALVNYLTSAGYPHLSAAWPPTLQIVGKDILRFHTVIWPALLLALQLPLPRHVLVHGHFTVNGTKMSKSLGNVVDPIALVRTLQLPAEALRFFILNEAGGTVGDVDFNEAALLVKYHSKLADTLGNLLARATNKKLLPEGVLPTPGPCLASDQPLVASLHALPGRVTDLFNRHDVRRALDAIFEVLYLSNKTFQEAAPWSTAVDSARRQTILFLALESLRVVGLLLQPVLPDAS